MQEMSKFTPYKYYTPEHEYNKKQKKVVKVVKNIVENTQDDLGTAHIYNITCMVLKKKKKLYNQFTENELYWICNEMLASKLCGLLGDTD